MVTLMRPSVDAAQSFVSGNMRSKPKQNVHCYIKVVIQKLEDTLLSGKLSRASRGAE